MKKILSNFSLIGCLVPVSLVVVCVLISCVLFSFIFIFSAIGGGLGEDTFVREIVADNNVDKTVAVVNLEGIILDSADSNYDGTIVEYMLGALDRIKQEENIIGAVIKMNTPGGGVYDSAIIADKIKEVKNEGKVIVSVVEGLSASGGYYVAAPTDHIVAHESSIVGSIGVLIQTTLFQEMFNKIGIDVITITNTRGVNKVWDEDLKNKDSEQYALIRNLLDDSYEEFIEVIAEGRDLKREDILPFADGRLMSAKDALNAGFIDKIGGFEEGVSYIKEAWGVETVNIENFDRKLYVGFDSFYASVGEFLRGINPNSIVEKGHNASIKSYYMPSIMFSNSSETADLKLREDN